MASMNYRLHMVPRVKICHGEDFLLSQRTKENLAANSLTSVASSSDFCVLVLSLKSRDFQAIDEEKTSEEVCLPAS